MFIYFGLILFIASGFVISAIGELTMRIIDLLVKPLWVDPIEELKHWRRLKNEKEYVMSKIERVWSFYAMNVNSVIALVLVLLVDFRTGNKSLSVSLTLVTLMIVFIVLAWRNYNKVYKWANHIKQEEHSEKSKEDSSSSDDFGSDTSYVPRGGARR